MILRKFSIEVCEFGWPAVKIRLTKYGAEHVKMIGVKILNEEISRLSGFQIFHSFSEQGVSGRVQLYNVNVLRYSPPQYTSLEFVSPSYVIFQMDRMDIALAGRFAGTVALIPVTGSVTGDIRQMSIRLQTKFNTAHNGIMQVKVVGCSTIVHYSHFSISANGALNGFVKMIEERINDVIRHKIPNIFCNSLQRIIEDSSPRLFHRLAFTNLTDHFHSIDLADNMIVSKLFRHLTNGLYMDNRNIHDPIVTSDYFETQQRGEIRYEDDSRPTPFNPPAMHTGNNSSRMLYFYGSEYLFNSLLYHAYQNDRMNIEINETILPPQYKPIVRTSCDSVQSDNHNFVSSLCLGTLIPEIAAYYPNSSSLFLMLPHQIPEFRLSKDIGSIDLKNRVLTYIRKGQKQKQIMVSTADLQADFHLLVENQRIAAALKINRFDIRLHRSAIKGINSNSITQLAPLAKTFFGPQLAKALRNGIPFPLKDSIEFINPELIIHDKFVEIATDFRFGEQKIREEVKKAFASVVQS
uniref:Lipid-binding serum glycoprotein C-terminal domain-containing protein n=1 Tax=Setaria digitata TaxID=48799 RepID=A0A915PZX0_9BILA